MSLSARILFLSRLTLLISTVFFSVISASKTKSDEDNFIKVAIIDTGISKQLRDAAFLCRSGHRDFTHTTINDTHGHGSHISGIIDQYAKGITLSSADTPSEIQDKLKAMRSKKIPYCQVVLKYWDSNTEANAKNTLLASLKALRYAIDLKVDIINYSGGGSSLSLEEVALIHEALDKHIVVVAAAGNDGVSLDTHGFYPAQADHRVLVVGNCKRALPYGPCDEGNTPTKYSNYGSDVKIWEPGEHVISYIHNGNTGAMSGTSQSTAIATGKLIKYILTSAKVK
jgi:major intracellular serine protease